MQQRSNHTTGGCAAYLTSHWDSTCFLFLLLLHSPGSPNRALFAAGPIAAVLDGRRFAALRGGLLGFLGLVAVDRLLGSKSRMRLSIAKRRVVPQQVSVTEGISQGTKGRMSSRQKTRTHQSASLAECMAAELV